MASSLRHMRVILVGSDRARASVRARTSGALTIVAEAATMALARATDVDADAWLVASDESRDDREDDEQPIAVEALTEREVQVLELVAEGLSNKSMAARLGISDQTIKAHVASIAGKLGTHNRTATVRRALRRGLITL